MCFPRISFPPVRGLLAAAALSAATLSAAPLAAQVPATPTPATDEAVGAARLAAQRSASGASFSLTWGGPVTAEVEIVVDGQEVRLRFSRPLGDAPLDKTPELLPGWVDNILYGYDSVLLLLNADAAATVEKRANGVRVVFTRKQPPKAVAQERDRADKAAQQRLGYLGASVELEQGNVRKARAALSELLQRDPKDVQTARLLAGAEERLGRWRRALRLSNYALTFTPGDPDLVRNKARLLHAYGDFVRTDYDVFAVRNADTQRVYKVTGRSNLPADGLLTYVLERRSIDTDQVTRRDGTVTPFHGIRSQATISYAKDWGDLQSTKVSLFAADATLGAGLLHEWRGDDRVLRFGGHWREPSYSQLEGLAEGGRRSRLFVEVEERLSPRVQAGVTAAVNSYGLDGDEDQLASSASLNGSIVYIVNEADPFVSVGYALDAEYVIDNKYYYDTAGNPFHPLSLSTREVHSLQASFERALTDYLTWGLVAGYAWDRRNEGAPFASASLRYEPLSDLEIGLRVSRTRATGRGTADVVDSAGGYLMMRY